MKEKVFPASVTALDDVLEFLDTELEPYDIPVKTRFSLKIAVEEIFVNVARYAYEKDDGDVTIALESDEDGITIVFIDCGIPFDPLAKPDPDITLSAEKRGIGGLGIFMVKKTMDQLGYEYRDGKNYFTMHKNFKRRPL